MSIKSIFKNFYWPLLLYVVVITCIGIVFIHAATSYTDSATVSHAVKQMIWLCMGVCFLFGITLIGYRSFLNLAYVLYISSLVLLVMVFFMGTGKFGAQRWIPIGGFALQPSEFAKIGLILALAHYLGNRKENLYQKKRFVVAFLLTFLPLMLIVKQPDLGTALIFLPILFLMLYLWGAKLKYIFISIVMGFMSLPLIWHILRDYQKNRLLSFININTDPLGTGYTAIQSKIAVGSGQLLGKGLFQGTQNRLNFVPEHHTDFIFCVIGEEGGFIAAATLLLLFAIIIRLAIGIIHKTTDPEAKLLATGITTMLICQIFINIGMTIGLCPITGLPLPLVSYGGSSLVMYYIAFGLLLSIRQKRSIW